MIEKVLLVFIGLAGGIAVGSGFVAFITVLDIVPRLHQLIRSPHRITLSEQAMTAGVVFWTCADFFGWQAALPIATTAAVGLFSGCFVGLLAAALTEVINVLPILAKRLSVEQWLNYILLAMVLGKVCGSLVQWLIVVP